MYTVGGIYLAGPQPRSLCIEEAEVASKRLERTPKRHFGIIMIIIIIMIITIITIMIKQHIPNT